MLDISPSLHFHYHSKQKENPSTLPVEVIIGNGAGWVKEVTGTVHVKPVANKTTLYLEGCGAMKINGSLTIGE